MKKNQIAINTLVYLEDISKGKTQYEFIKMIKKLGLKAIEIRREYIKDTDIELSKIKDLSRDYGIEVYYSVPDTLFKNGELKKNLDKYIEETKAMGAVKVKFNIGEFNGFTKDSAAVLKGIAADKEILITIENDQTDLSGKISSIKKFLEACSENNINIFYTLDIGNWCWTGEDPIKNALELKEYTKYIHLKDIKFEDGKPCTAYLDEGTIKWREVLSIFSSDIPVALEYPCGDDPEKVIKKEIEKMLLV